MNDISFPQISTHVERLHAHFQSYYETLDLAASDDVTQLLYSDWRNPLEKPFLWLGDFHPYIFTCLLRSFLGDSDEDDYEDIEGFDDLGHVDSLESCELYDRPWHILMAWKDPSKILMAQIDQIECGLRLMVPSLVTRAKTAQEGFVKGIAENWGRCEDGKKETMKEVVGDAMEGQMDELVSVFLDANRLRRSVLGEIMGAIDVYQRALFLEGLAQFLVGFSDPQLLAEFKRCKTPLNRRKRIIGI